MLYFHCCLFFSVLIGCVYGQYNFADFFANCKTSDSQFDSCIKDALNAVRPYFKTGVPELNVPPFDPFFAKEVPQKRGPGPNLNYKLKLKDVMESGWTQSQVTRFRSDFSKNLVQYTQSFPEKYLEGNYDISGSVLGNKIVNQGRFNLTLYDLVQTTTVTWKPILLSDGTTAHRFKVNVNVQTIKNLSLHISNLLGGRPVVESIMDGVINSSWQLGFPFFRPLINDLVSTAFTEIFNNSFFNFPFEQIIH